MSEAVPTLARLHRLGRTQDGRKQEAQERCDLCGLGLLERHRHALDLRQSPPGVRCACAVCALLLTETSGGLRLIPTVVRALGDLALEDEPWAALGVPINLAYFTRRDDGEVCASYPSPAGAVDAQPSREAWDGIAARHEAIAAMRPYVDALLVDATTETKRAFIVPVDLCFELTGLVRRHWRGLSGGDEVRAALSAFFRSLDTRASA